MAAPAARDVHMPSAANAKLDPQFVALLDKEKVPDNFRDWLVSEDVNVLNIRAFAACSPSKDKVDEAIIAASGVALTFVGKGDGAAGLGVGYARKQCGSVERRTIKFSVECTF